MISFNLRIDEQNDAHTTVSVFSGERDGSRGRSGVLIFRNEEWIVFRSIMLESVRSNVEITGVADFA